MYFLQTFVIFVTRSTEMNCIEEAVHLYIVSFGMFLNPFAFDANDFWCTVAFKTAFWNILVHSLVRGHCLCVFAPPNPYQGSSVHEWFSKKLWSLKLLSLRFWLQLVWFHTNIKIKIFKLLLFLIYTVNVFLNTVQCYRIFEIFFLSCQINSLLLFLLLSFSLTTGSKDSVELEVQFDSLHIQIPIF